MNGFLVYAATGVDDVPLRLFSADEADLARKFAEGVTEAQIHAALDKVFGREISGMGLDHVGIVEFINGVPQESQIVHVFTAD